MGPGWGPREGRRDGDGRPGLLRGGEPGYGCWGGWVAGVGSAVGGQRAWVTGGSQRRVAGKGRTRLGPPLLHLPGPQSPGAVSPGSRAEE